ncbi:hypothetical protein ILUMI_08814, partial [Ignelater luminosus]
MNSTLRLLSLFLIVKFVRSEVDEYLYESQQQCSTKNNLLSCAKYRTLRYLTTIGHQYGIIGNETSDSPVRLIKMDRYHQEPELFPTARQLPGDSEFTKFLKFAQRQLNYYMGTQGIVFDLPEGAEILEQNRSYGVEEGRGKKKKAAIVLMPLIILFKLFKIKIMVAMVLASLVFIKKAIMLAALILPSILQHLKHCSKTHYVHHPPVHHHEDVHDHEDFGGGLSGGYYGGYSKDYER